MEKLIKILEDNGFTSREAKIYITTLQLGTAPASLIARQSKFDRSNTYHILMDLTEKGIVFCIHKKNGTFFYALSPEQLSEKLAQKHKAFDDKLDQFQELMKNQWSKPKILIYEGESNVKDMLKNNRDKRLKVMSESDNTRRWFQDASFVKTHFERLKSYWKVKPKNQKVCLLSNVTNLEKKIMGKVPNRLVREMPSHMTFESTIRICGTYIITIVSKETAIYAYEIEDNILATTLRSLFKEIRNTLT